MSKIKIKQHTLKSPYECLETILLIDDKEAERLGNWTVGYFHCTHCDKYRSFAYQLPEYDPTSDGSSKLAHSDRNQFWHAHSHGDRRILLFERDD